MKPRAKARRHAERVLWLSPDGEAFVLRPHHRLLLWLVRLGQTIKAKVMP
jgi:hypothetical protein